MTYAVTGFPSSYRAPFSALQLLFGQGPSNAPVGTRDALYVVPILSSGTATANVRQEVSSSAQAAELFGLGSSGHRIMRMHERVNPNGRVYMVGYAVSSGGSPAAAEEDITVTCPSADTATGTGSFDLVVCGYEFTVGYRSGDTETVIGDAIAAYINAATFLPVTASNSAGVVTVTAKVIGASQNSVHRIRVKRNGDSGTGCSVAVGAATLTGGVDGTTTELANFTAALAAMSAISDYYVVTPVTVSGFAAALKTHVATKNEPNPGILCRGFFPSVGALAATATIAIAQNSEVIECAWLRDSDNSPDEVVAWYTAVKQKEEQVQARFNFDYYPATGFLSPAPNVSSWPDVDDIGDAVDDGIAPIVSTATSVYLAMGVTTRSKDSTGSTDDFRAAESHRVSIMHEVGATIRLNHRLTYTNFAQQDDPYLPNGQVDEGALQTLVSTREDRFTTPSLFKKWLKSQIQQLANGRLQQVPDWLSSVKTRIDPQNNGRMQCAAAGRTVDLHHQVSFRLSETTPN